jgi:hypothetical protein
MTFIGRDTFGLTDADSAFRRHEPRCYSDRPKTRLPPLALLAIVQLFYTENSGLSGPKLSAHRVGSSCLRASRIRGNPSIPSYKFLSASTVLFEAV